MWFLQKVRTPVMSYSSKKLNDRIRFLSKPQRPHLWALLNRQYLFSKIRLRHFFYFMTVQLQAKNEEKPTSQFCKRADEGTDEQSQIHRTLPPAAGVQKSTVMGRERIIILDSKGRILKN